MQVWDRQERVRGGTKVVHDFALAFDRDGDGLALRQGKLLRGVGLVYWTTDLVLAPILDKDTILFARQ